jgi:hypothetical protein
MTWHSDHDLLTRFARAPELLDTASAASVEAHLVRCGVCRQVVADSGDAGEVAASWHRIVDVLDRPVDPVPVRLLARLGLPADTARVVGATRELSVAWCVAVVGLATVAVVLARLAGSPGPFLAIAPVVPAIVVWLAFSPVAEPAGEAGVATPLAGAGLLLRRLVAVEVPAVVALVVASLGVPGASLTAAGWLLPATALAVCCLALATSFRVATAATGVLIAWMTALTMARAVEQSRPVAESFVFGSGGQFVAVALACAGALLCWRRRDRFSTLEVMW